MNGSKLNKSQSKYYNTACLMDEALIAMLDKKEYSFITVKEICDKAGVNRSTFYLHYETMDDLLCETIEYIGNGIREKYKNQDVIDVKKIATCSLEDLILITPKYLFPYLEFIKARKKVFKASYTQPNILKTQEITGYLYKKIFEPILVRFNVPEKERNYRIIFALKGIGAIIMEWVKKDCTESIEEMADIIINCFNIREILCKS